MTEIFIVIGQGGRCKGLRRCEFTGILRMVLLDSTQQILMKSLNQQKILMQSM